VGWIATTVRTDGAGEIDQDDTERGSLTGSNYGFAAVSTAQQPAFANGTMTKGTSDQRVEAESLVVVCGFPGVGKTTVAETVADRLDGELLRTDVVRKELVADPEYTDEETAAVYEEVLDRSRRRIEDGHSVVLDGTFFRQTFREAANSLAGDLGVEFEVVRVRCDEDTVERRIRQRDGISDADVEVYHMHRDIFEPIDRDHVTVDNSEDLEATRRQVLTHF
jgi:hypothetical protein